MTVQYYCHTSHPSIYSRPVRHWSIITSLPLSPIITSNSFPSTSPQVRCRVLCGSIEQSLVPLPSGPAGARVWQEIYPWSLQSVGRKEAAWLRQRHNWLGSWGDKYYIEPLTQVRVPTWKCPDPCRDREPKSEREGTMNGTAYLHNPYYSGRNNKFSVFQCQPGSTTTWKYLPSTSVYQSANDFIRVDVLRGFNKRQ